jgi:hypothetical protein
MKRSIIFFVIAFGIVFTGFRVNDGLLLPESKLDKAISNLWKGKPINLIEIHQDKISSCQQKANVFEILSGCDLLGYAIINRVNSCRAGGCNIDNDEEAISFEFFDYFIITDNNFHILKVNVYNYQATHGHEVMSKGWLGQFIGFSGQEKLVYGKDIEAISGATVSAIAINEDIYATIDCMKNQLH